MATPPLLAGTSALTLFTHESVVLDGTTSEGHPVGYKWFVTPPQGTRPPQPDSTDPTFTLPLDRPGDWGVALDVQYAHSVDGAPYDAPEVSTVLTVHSVVAALTEPPGPVDSDADIVLDGTGSQIANGVQAEISWTISSGTSTYTGCPAALTCTIPAYSLEPGSYTVQLTLRDPTFGETASATVPLDVAGISAKLSWQLSAPSTTAVAFDALVSSTYGSITSVDWIFGDGTEQILTCAHYPECIQPTHDYAEEGRYQVTLKAFDFAGHSGVADAVVTTGGFLFADGFESGGLANWESAASP